MLIGVPYYFRRLAGNLSEELEIKYGLPCVMLSLWPWTNADKPLITIFKLNKRDILIFVFFTKQSPPTTTTNNHQTKQSPPSPNQTITLI